MKTPNTTPVSATSAALVRLLGAGPARVSLDGGVLRFGDAEGTPVGGIDSIETRRSWFWTRLTVREAGGAERAIGGLARNEAERLAQAVRADAARVAGALAPELTQLRDRLNRLHASRRYARKSQSSGLQADIASTVERGGGALARAFLPAQAAGALARIQPVARIEAYEAAREEANARFVAATAPAVARAAQGVLSSPPTAEQAKAIATDEDATLVLAGAGTGKTAVITGKIAHLVRNRGVPPRQILVLAFNRKAAEEIRQRLPDDLAGAHVATFHAFGRRVIADVEVAPTLSKLAEDEAMLTVVIDRILVDLVGDPRQSRVVADFITRHRADYRSQFEFDTPGQYYDYVRRSELRTLSGDLVKSFEELEIANFLTQNSVSFHYEQPYPVETATPWHRQYRPDFYLPDHDIYIEHFALDRQGRPPTGWTGYAEGVGWKRDIHQRYGTRLIETYSWQQREGVLRHRLRQQLEEAGVTFQRVPLRTLLLELGRWLISWLAQLIATFLNHVKASGISVDTLRERARDSGDRTRGEAFLDLFEQVSSRYDRLLGEEKDFHDLINHAAAHIRNGRWESPYRYVLVDEFQDISAGRMALLRALKGRGVAYFLVGDDWQSIYRFAGSDVALVRECGRYLGHVRERALSRTFRFARGIMEPSTAFVVRNPAQTQRTLRPAQGVRDGGVTVIASDDPARGLRDALRDIQACEGASGAPVSVLVLGRYRRSRGALPPPRRGAAAPRVQHGACRQGPRGRLRGRTRPQGRPPRLSFAARGRSTAPPRAAASAWRLIPARRGAAPVLRRVDAGASRYLPGGGLAASLSLRERAAPGVHSAAPPRRVQARPHAGLPALPHREPRRVEYGAAHELPELSLLPLSRAALSDLQAGLRGDLRSLVPLHQPLVRRQPAGLPVVPRRRHGHPQRPPRLVPRLLTVRLRPAVHEHPEFPQAQVSQHRPAVCPRQHKRRPKPQHLRIPPHRSPNLHLAASNHVDTSGSSVVCSRPVLVTRLLS